MPFILEPMSDADKRRIFDESDSAKQAWLRMRSFFETASDTWAIDRDGGNYLVWVPTYLPRGFDRNFFFRFEGKTYALRVKNGFGPQVAVDDPVAEGARDRIHTHIAEAFSVHKLYGREFVPQFGQTWPTRCLD